MPDAARLPRLVATDLDGTLLHSDGTVTARTRAVLAELDDLGVPVVFTTGRPVRWMEDLWEAVGGHGLAIGGVVVDSGRFPWDNGKFKTITDPSPAYHGLEFHATFGMYGYLQKLRSESMRDIGAPLSPFHSFLFLLGLELRSVALLERVDPRAILAPARERGLPGGPHPALGAELRHLGDVDLAPIARRLARCEALDVALVVDAPHHAVDPAEAERFVDRL